MTITLQSTPARRTMSVVALAVGIAGLLALNPATAETEAATQKPGPLALSERGGFYLGGHSVEQSFVELGSRRPADRVTVGQMYVEHMVPTKPSGAAIILVHGAGLTGHSYDATPDGRMGWFEYFVRAGRPVYVVDQIGRGRSGFDQSTINNVRVGVADPDTLPDIFRMADRYAAWINFRIGPDAETAFEDTQFPIEAIAELSRQGVPDLAASLPMPNPNIEALEALAQQLGGAVLLGHSQSGAFPLDVALQAPDLVKAMVLVEPGDCQSELLTDEQLKRVASIPLLVVYGDHLDAPTFVPGPGWQGRFNGCQKLISRLRGLGGDARMLHPPDIGIKGNSHMLMHDRNNLQIAQFILDWLDGKPITP